MLLAFSSAAFAATAFSATLSIMPGALPESDQDPPASAAFGEPALGVEAGDEALPPLWDWRNQGGISYMSPVAAQGRCGACVSFAVVSALEAALTIACDSPERPFRMSTQFAFSCSGGTCRGGQKVSEAMNFLAQTGTPDAPCLEYAAGDGIDVACTSACADWRLRTVEGITFEEPTVGFIDVTKIKRALLKAPLVSNMILFEDLATHRTGVYRHRSGNQIGMHAVVLVGWNDEHRSWIVRNSLGPDWGDGGYFEVAWDDASLPGRYTWLMDVSAPRTRGICLYPR